MLLIYLPELAVPRGWSRVITQSPRLILLFKPVELWQKAVIRGCQRSELLDADTSSCAKIDNRELMWPLTHSKKAHPITNMVI